MKRIPELRDLSADHHHGLSLARTAKKAAAGDGGALAGAWAEVEAAFRAELEPHFEIEETLMAPALDGAGESGLVRRLHDEHAALRAFVGPGGDRSADALRRFGELLEQHIRFEERELFEVAQAVMTPDALRAIEAAGRKRRG